MATQLLILDILCLLDIFAVAHCSTSYVVALGLVTVEEKPLLSIPPHSSGKNLALNIGTLLRQILGAHGVVNTGNALLNNGTLIQISSNKVSGGTDNLDTTLVSLVVRLGSLERRQETVVDVDDASRHGLAQCRRENLHVTSQDNKFNAVLLAELKNLSLLLSLGILCHGEMVELNSVALGEGGVLGVVGNNNGNLHAKLASLHAEEKIVETVTNLGDHDEDSGLAGNGTNIVFHLVLGGELVKSFSEVLGRFGLGRTKVNSHKETLRDGIGELLEVENVVLVVGKDTSHGINNAGLVGARQSEDVIVGHVEGLLVC
ncbi:unnamed protein product [Fusarium graminearum]|nr:unnamed protein product [Fusarium graminearum]